MKSIYFISDIHLDPNNSKVTKKFIEFINNKSSDMKELYILGDLFEFWIDDKYDIIQNNLIISTLKKISENGTKIFLMHGDNDTIVPSTHLLEAKEYLKNCGINIKIKMFQNCEHRIPVEGSSFGLAFLKKNLL